MSVKMVAVLRGEEQEQEQEQGQEQEQVVMVGGDRKRAEDRATLSLLMRC